MIEIECLRLSVEQGRYWEAIRLFLKEAAEKWYNTTRQTTKSTSWEFWKNFFIENFEQKGLADARLAYPYRNISGSLTDYLQNTHNLLVSFNPNMYEKDKIGHIALGLLLNLQNQINFSEITCLDKLTSTINWFNILSMHSISNNLYNNTSLVSSNAFSSFRAKSLCPYCKKQGFERFHFEKYCFTKFEDSQRKTSNNNVTKAIHNLEIDDLQNEINEIQKTE